MSKQGVINRLNETLERIMREPVLLDTDGRLSERGEYELNLHLVRNGLRVARNPDGSRQHLACANSSLRIEADGPECEHCAHGRHAHPPFGCRVEGCECQLFEEHKP